MGLTESERKNIKYLVITIFSLYGIVSFIASIAFLSYEPELKNQWTSIGVSLLIMLSVGTSNFTFSSNESQILGVIFGIFGLLTYGLVGAIITIYLKSKANDLPSAKGGFKRK